MPRRDYPLGRMLQEIEYFDRDHNIVIHHIPTGLEVVCQGTGKRAWSLGFEAMEQLILKRLDEETLLDSMKTLANPCPM